MNKTEFYRALDELLEVEPGTTNGAQPLADLEGWDSVTVLSFIAMADEKYGVNIPVKSIVTCQKVDDLAAIVGELQTAPK